MKRGAGYLFWLTLVAAGPWTPATAATSNDAPSAWISLLCGRSTGDCAAACAVAFVFPGEAAVRFYSPRQDWTAFRTLEYEIAWPATAPSNVQVLAYVKDGDYNWFQSLAADRLHPGRTNSFCVELGPEARGWEPRGHAGLWHFRVLVNPQEVGLRVFGEGAGRGTGTVVQVRGRLRDPDRGVPWIRNVRASATAIPRFGTLELAMELPDRYINPFQTNEVLVTAEIVGPDGRTNSVPGFYWQDYTRSVHDTIETITPQGAPGWRVRFAPRQIGTYRYTLCVRDSRGQATWGPAEFAATSSASHGFVRVAKSDPRFFEFDDGTFFHPLGHNVRSPSDARYQTYFPLAPRMPEGSAIYTRYFQAMQAAGENCGEVWTAGWSLGLEWTDQWTGYHGIGTYNLIHAWELDQVLAEAARRDIYLNLVIHNHGKFSTYWDTEWAQNPFNKINGGYLSRPEEYFSDPRARESFRMLMRYMIARWSHNDHLLSWQFWSELDLTGTGSDMRGQRPAEVVAWHREMGRDVKAMDPSAHLITTHVCNDYTHQNPEIISLPEIDYCAVDAYAYGSHPLQIVELMQQTANFNGTFGKPVLITEFGGSPHGQDVEYLERAFHAALWASVGVPLGGTPMFWWWGLIEDRNYYSEFNRIRAFLKDEDRRGKSLVARRPEIWRGPSASSEFAATCLADGERGLGWISAQNVAMGPRGAGAQPSMTNLVMILRDMGTGARRVEFWATETGQPCATVLVTNLEAGVLSVPIPPFPVDIAFKIKPLSHTNGTAGMP